MYVIVTGLRGIPGIQGGVETHAENLYPLLVSQGCDIEIIARSIFYKIDPIDNWKGIRIHRIWSPQKQAFEAFFHTFLAILYAGFKRPDILHIHAVGPMIMTPLARIFGLKVVVTHHGPDYDREKWGNFAKWTLRLGERLGIKYSTERIVISDVIKNLVKEKYKKDAHLIPNGVVIPEILNTNYVLREFNLERNKYVLQVSRFVPEKRQLDLINSFQLADLPNWKLVLVGDLSSSDTYIKKIFKAANGDKSIVLTGFQGGENLQELYSNAGLFVLPSSHEGLPIAILEALSYGLRVLSSNIPANLEIGLPPEQYYPLGNVDCLAEKIRSYSNLKTTGEYKKELRGRIKDDFNWMNISKQTFQVYKKAVYN